MNCQKKKEKKKRKKTRVVCIFTHCLEITSTNILLQVTRKNAKNLLCSDKCLL